MAVILVAAVATAVIALRIPDPGLSPQLAERRPDPVRGAYIATLGDCAGCHTAPGGKSLAGGRPFPTPVGLIYSTNITPDPNHGIGHYSLNDFGRLMRQGVRPDGVRVYPAMPYTAFAKVSDADLQDLFAYLTRTVAPAETADRRGDAPWPLSLRWPLALWNVAFHHDRRFVPEAGRDPAWNRGAYLVQGLAHCGTCHTPRGLAFQEKDVDGRADLFLSGSRLDGQSPINLRGDMGDGLGRWSAAEIVELLATGRSPHSAAVGSMGEVVAASTQYIAPADLAAIATYLKSLGPAPGARATFVPDRADMDAIMAGRQNTVGGRMFMDSCAACHRLSGSGEGRALPTLAGSSTVLAAHPDTLVAVILQGARAPGTAGAPSRSAMPPFGWRYTDAEVAALATYVRQAWGNHASDVSARQVRAIRADLDKARLRR